MMLLTVGNARYNQRKDSCRSPASGGLLQLFSAASRTGLWSRVHQPGWSSSMSFAETSARASCLAPVRRAIPLPSPGDARSLVRGAKTRTRPAQLSISRPRRPGHSAGALGVVDARASKATALGEASHHALSGCQSAEPPACHLGAQHHPRAQPTAMGHSAHPM